MDKKSVEAIYPLSPMQQGLLFHTLQAGGEDPGLLLQRCRLEGDLAPDRFVEVWDEVVRRHPVLRTVLRWRNLDEPLQIVLRTVEVPWTIEDWRAQRPMDQERSLQAYLATERERGLDLGQVPTMRLALFRLDDTAWHLVWTCHHVLLDGWSGALVLQDAVARYNAQAQGDVAAWSPAPPFQHYVRWLKAQAEDEAETFWRGHLSGTTAPTPLPFDSPEEEALAELQPGYDRQVTELPAHTSAALQALARRYQFTLSSVLYGAWAMLLSQYSRQNTVVFGSTTSGRAVDVPGVEAMAGLLINTLPIRASVDPDASALDLFRALHAAQADQVRYAYSSPAQIQAWSEVPAHQRLFESLMVIENYPHATPMTGPLALSDLQSGITSNFPLTLIVNPGEALHLYVIYDRLRFRQAAMTRLLFHFEHLLRRIAEAPEDPVGALLPEGVVGSTASLAASGQPGARNQLQLDDYAAPRDAVEHQLVRIWEDVLNVRPIGIHDGFFDLGGQSMRAVQLLNRVEHAFGKKLPLALLFEANTIAQMADVLRDEVEVHAWDALVPLKPGGTRPPLYCIHSYDGQVMFYRQLAQHVGPDQPVYGLQSVGLDGAVPPLTDVKEMAVRYVEEIRSVQPEGPYTLLSICFGIAVALEMARLLTDQGEEVPMVFVLDSGFAHLRREKAGTAPRGRLRKLQRAFGMLRDGSLIREFPQHLAVHGRKLIRPFKRFQSARETAAEGPQEHRIWRVNDANIKAWENYRATPYAGAVTLVRSSAWGGWDAKQWHVPVWTELALGGLTVRTVPSVHENMLREPYVQALAAQLEAAVDALQQSGDGEAGPGALVGESSDLA